MESDMTDEPKPWSIRGVHPEVRNAALAAAKRNNMTIGEWLDRAIRSHIKNVNNQEGNLSDKSVQQVTDLSDAERIVNMIAKLSEAGAPVPKSVASKAYSVIRNSLKGTQLQHKSILPAPEKE